MDTILLGIALVLSIAWLVIRMRRDETPVKSDEAKILAHEKVAYHAVSIALEQSACDAAKSMTGRRFLSDAAPQLPLPDCDALECRCIFTHHQDRRENRDRRSPFAASGFGGSVTGSHQKERRARKERREDPDFEKF